MISHLPLGLFVNGYGLFIYVDLFYSSLQLRRAGHSRRALGSRSIGEYMRVHLRLVVS
jgi:hypothetical protein